MKHHLVMAVLIFSVLSGERAAASTPEQEMQVEWALGQFETAGLHLPPLMVVFASQDTSACGGAQGRTQHHEIPVVTMCWEGDFLLLHELAHVWIAQNVDAAQRTAFMATRDDVTEWTDSEVRWDHRGSEHAANVIAWGLLETPYPVSQTYPNDKANLREGFEILTGREPLHDGGPDITLVDRASFAGRSNPPRDAGR